MKTIRSEFTANQALSLAPKSTGQDQATRRAQANGWKVGRHAFKPGKPRIIPTRPSMGQRIARAVFGWL